MIIRLGDSTALVTSFGIKRKHENITRLKISKFTETYQYSHHPIYRPPIYRLIRFIGIHRDRGNR